MTATVECHPLTRERWGDLETLFGSERGANGGCWCMYWRTLGSQKAFYAGDRGARKDAFSQIVAGAQTPPGIIAYADGVPAGWVAVAPRCDVPRFNAQKASKLQDGADDLIIWAVTCFFIDRPFRGSGLMRQLLDAAVAFARTHGAAAIDAAPLDVTRKLVAGEGYVGIASVFADTGFKVVARNSTAKPLMRLEL